MIFTGFFAPLHRRSYTRGPVIRVTTPGDGEALSCNFCWAGLKNQKGGPVGIAELRRSRIIHGAGVTNHFLNTLDIFTDTLDYG